ncbi:MAG: hypothetical protein V5B38_13425 [Candidatus Accumulibacter propinquus]|jgi:hypothetical protein
MKFKISTVAVASIAALLFHLSLSPALANADLVKGAELIKSGLDTKDQKLMDRGAAILARAANSGNAECAFNLSVYYTGIAPGLPNDREKKCYWVTKAANMGYAEAYFGAASCAMGDKTDPATFEAKMLPWIRKIATNGDTEEARRDARATIDEWEQAKRDKKTVTLGDILAKMRK